MQRFVPVEASFKGRHFDGQIIILCVSWYTSFKLSLRDLAIMMADRGIRLTHTTILRWSSITCPNSKNRRKPMKITRSRWTSIYAASNRAVREMKAAGELSQAVKVRSSQYLNNLIEQDQRRAKQRIRPMLGFKRFDNAAITISGIELAEKIRKGQFKSVKFISRTQTLSEPWSAALAA